MGRIIAIANQKGGVGKTTTSINLAACIAEKGKKVLAIDLDPQGNMTSGLGVDKNEVENTVYELMLDECTIKESMQDTVEKNLKLIASNVNLAGAEIELLGINDKEYKKIVKNYFILALIFLAVVLLVWYICKWYTVCNDYKKEIPVIRGTLNYEITESDFEHYILENPSSVVYMCTASEEKCRDFE